jgi:hypothetical protein
MLRAVAKLARIRADTIQSTAHGDPIILRPADPVLFLASSLSFSSDDNSHTQDVYWPEDRICCGAHVHLQASSAPSLLLHEPPVSAESVVPACDADWRLCPRTFRQLPTQSAPLQSTTVNVSSRRNLPLAYAPRTWAQRQQSGHGAGRQSCGLWPLSSRLTHPIGFDLRSVQQKM